MSFLAIGQSTTSTSAFLFGRSGQMQKLHAAAHAQIHPHPGWVEHVPNEILSHVADAIAAGRAGLCPVKTGRKLSGLGRANRNPHQPHHRLAGCAHHRPLPPDRQDRNQSCRDDRAPASDPLFFGLKAWLDYGKYPAGCRHCHGRTPAPWHHGCVFARPADGTV
ncbi:hypothetical protein KMP13_09800 [Epibacterium ulvae]|nr:hypothetical protein [Epibacterium ulvae]